MHTRKPPDSRNSQGLQNTHISHASGAELQGSPQWPFLYYMMLHTQKHISSLTRTYWSIHKSTN